MSGSGGRFRRTCQRPDPVELALRPPFAVETKDPIPVAAADDPPGKRRISNCLLAETPALGFRPHTVTRRTRNAAPLADFGNPMGKIGSGRCSTRLSYTRLAPRGGIRTPDHLVRSDETASCTTIGPDAETPGGVV